MKFPASYTLGWVARKRVPLVGSNLAASWKAAQATWDSSTIFANTNNNNNHSFIRSFALLQVVVCVCNSNYHFISNLALVLHEGRRFSLFTLHPLVAQLLKVKRRRPLHQQRLTSRRRCSVWSPLCFAAVWLRMPECRVRVLLSDDDWRGMW